MEIAAFPLMILLSLGDRKSAGTTIKRPFLSDRLYRMLVHSPISISA